MRFPRPTKSCCAKGMSRTTRWLLAPLAIERKADTGGMPPRPVQLTYSVYGDPYDVGTQSGIATNLGSALAKRPEFVIGEVDTSLSRSAVWLAAARNVRRGRDRWLWATHLGPEATRARTRALVRSLERETPAADVVLHLRATYLPIGVPYVPYIDNTVELGLNHWPRSAPWSGRRLGIIQEYERAFFQGARHIFVTGRLVAESLTSFYEVPAAAVTVVGAGANFAPLHSLREAEQRPWILFVGYDFTRKGGDRLLRAFRRVRREHPGARLKLVGPELRLTEPGVDVLGPIHDRQRLSDLYARSRVFALPVRYEPYGMAFLEAMAHGLACVGTNEGAVSEIIEHERTGYIVHSGEVDELAGVLSSLIGDPERAAALGNAGRQRVTQHLNWDNVVATMTPVLRHP